MEPVKMKIWKTKRYVVSKCNGLVSYQKIIDETEMIEDYNVFEDNGGKVIVLSSTGYTAQHMGNLLGQYKYSPDQGCYVQKNTEKGKPNFLYPTTENKWHMGPSRSGRFILWSVIKSNANKSRGEKCLIFSSVRC